MSVQPETSQKFLMCVCVSIHNAVIAVFQRRDLGENELYVLNEGVRWVTFTSPAGYGQSE